jgi:hypothetical protein
VIELVALPSVGIIGRARRSKLCSAVTYITYMISGKLLAQLRFIACRLTWLTYITYTVAIA